MSYSTGSSRAAERIILYVMLLLAVVVWGVFGGEVFIGILRDVGAP